MMIPFGTVYNNTVHVKIKNSFCHLYIFITTFFIIQLFSFSWAQSVLDQDVNQFDAIDCPISCSCLGTFVDCSKRKLNHVPNPLPIWCETLDLSENSIDEILPGSFRGLVNLKKLYLTKNQLKFVSSNLFSDIQVPNTLTIHKCHTPQLQEIKFDNNLFNEFPHLIGLENLTTINFNHNNIDSLVNASTDWYPNLQTIELNSNKVSNIPSGFFSNSSKITHLYLTNNRIVTFDKGAFDNLTSLEVLKLTKNRIIALPKELLRNLRNLKELDLTRNKMTSIEGLTFNGLESLHTLKLRRNDLLNLYDGSFWGLNNIQYLHLDHNNLSLVRKGWLYGLTSLKMLSLSHNQISEVDGDGWEFCKKLWEVDLSYNSIESITKDTFSRFQSLQTLLLDHNSISFIEENAFKSLTLLETLSLSQNQISWTIEDSSGAFTGLERLITLNLAHNQIKSIAKRAFIGLNKIQTLDLSSNPITSIQDQSFASFKNLHELKLNSTDLVCDCNLKWLILWLKNGSTPNQHDIHHSKCKHPKWLVGKNLLEANPDEFTCEDFPKPYITEDPKKDENPISALKGNRTTLTCKAASSSSSQMHFQWRKDNQIIHPDSIAKNQIFTFAHVSNETLSEYTSIFQLNNIDDDDEGKYQCIVSNQFGVVYSQKVRINVHVMPVFTKVPQNVSAKVGETVRLECAAKGQPAPEIAWQKESGDDFPAARERRMHVMPTDDIFFMVEVKLSDMGMYTCTATNAAGTIASSAFLNVQEQPSFVRPMHKQKETIAGETAVLECMASGSPKPTLTWYKDGNLSIATERHFFTADNQLLIIVKTQLSDTGIYTCEMSNQLGNVSDSTTLIITPRIPSINEDEDENWNYIWTDSKIAGIIIIAVFICIVFTSFIWVVIIYKTRKRGEDYTHNTDETTLPGELDSFNGGIISGSSCGVIDGLVPNDDNDDSDEIISMNSESQNSFLSNKENDSGIENLNEKPIHTKYRQYQV